MSICGYKFLYLNLRKKQNIPFSQADFILEFYVKLDGSPISFYIYGLANLTNASIISLIGLYNKIKELTGIA